MRRAERQITDLVTIKDIFAQAVVCRLGMCDLDGIPYIVPLNYGYEFFGNMPCLYFHGAQQGKKVDIIKTNPVICFEIDNPLGVKMSNTPEGHSFYYQSIVGWGRMEILTENADKIYALQKILSQVKARTDFVFDSKVLDYTLVMALKVDKYTGKQNIAK